MTLPEDQDQTLERLLQSPGIRLAGAYGAILLLSLMLVAGISYLRISSLIEGAINAWGENVAEQLAHSTLDAVMQKDAIALQAHLGRLMKSHGGVSATVYDVQNNLLAQAGASPRELHGRIGVHAFPATLALGDNIIGRVVVVIDAGEVETLHRELYWTIGGGGALGLLLLLIVSRHFARQAHTIHRKASRAFVRAMPQEILPAELTNDAAVPLLDASQFSSMLEGLRQYVSQLQQPAPAQLLAAAADLMNPAEACAYVLVEVRKLELLQRQVSRDRLRGLLGHFLQQVGNTARLYGAQRVPAVGASVKLLFPARDNPSQAAFQAVCCAHVLAGLLRDCVDQELGIALQWTIAVDWHLHNSNELLRNLQRTADEQRSHWVCEQIGSGQLACSAELAEQLREQQRIELLETSGTGGRIFNRIGGMAESQRRMLDGQVEQLREI